MSRYTVTHVDAERVRRRLVISAVTRAAAQDFAEGLYGVAWYLSAMRLRA